MIRTDAIAKYSWRTRPVPASERGTVLLLALIIMSSVVLASMGLGSLIIAAIQQSRIIDNAAIAYYAAESAAEDALYAARKTDTIPASVTTSQVLANGASWIRQVTDTEDVVYVGTVLTESLVEVALYNPDTQVPSATEQVEVTWSDRCAGCTVLTASLVGWQPGTPWDPVAAANVDFSAARYTGGTATLSVPSPGKLYRIRIRSGKGAMDDVRIRAYNGTGQPVPLPGRISIDARGGFGGVEQKLLVSVPRKTPLSGVYDFVVFSECSIVKGGAITCP